MKDKGQSYIEQYFHIALGDKYRLFNDEVRNGAINPLFARMFNDHLLTRIEFLISFLKQNNENIYDRTL